MVEGELELMRKEDRGSGEGKKSCMLKTSFERFQIMMGNLSWVRGKLIEERILLGLVL